jgi:membrane-bound serine protease (ClpP class)
MNSVLRRSIVLLCFAALLLGQDAASPDQPAPPAAGASKVLPGADVAVIRIEGIIYDFTLDSLKRRVERAIAGGASAIVIELDTNGGLVDSALKIAKYIKGDIPVPTIAWVHSKAYSAGILIASSCDELVMSPASTTGDCAPIVPGTELAPTERAKALSPLLEEFRDNARRNGYDYAMFHAMCVLGVELYMVEHKDTGEQRIVNQADYAVMVDGVDLDEAATSPGAAAQAAGAMTLPDIYGVSPEVATEADRGMWTKVRLLHDGKTLLTVNQDRAFDMGLARSKSIRNTADLKLHLAAASVTPVPQTWSENVAGWLTSLPVRAVLILALMLGAYVELQTPGLGFPGAIALTALVLLFGAPYLIGLAEIWHIVLFFVGLVLLLIELLVIPGFGIFGIAGLICMLAGLVLAVVPTSGSGPISLPPSEMVGRLQLSLIWTMLGVVAAFIGFYNIAKHFKSIPLLNRMILQEPQVVPAGAAAGGESVGFGRVSVGDVGRAVTGLHPGGRVEIDGHLVDVVTSGGWIDAGTPIKVVEVAGNRIVVEQSDDV